MKIGILGGTFNPPHKGHLRLAREAAEAAGLEKVIIMPDNIPPHKSSGSLVSAEDRLNMCRIAFDDPLFEISTLELERGNKSYTYDTLKSMKATYPHDDFYFIVGSDMLFTFRQWYRWDDILSMCTLVALSRERGFTPDFSGYTDEQVKKIMYVEAEPFVVSSTEIRHRLKSNYNCEELLDTGVLDYIKDHNLYDDEFDSYRRIMEKMLDSKRFYHSECVSDSAGELAELYGADVQKARLAGLLHDITKRMPEDEQMSLLTELTPLEKKNYKVWHQMSAPIFLRNNGIINDEEILGAIRWHTTGRANMTLLEKIVYTADFISADREYPDVDTVRKLATISLEHAMLYTCRYTVQDLVKYDRPVHPSTLELYNDLLQHFGL